MMSTCLIVALCPILLTQTVNARSLTCQILPIGLPNGTKSVRVYDLSTKGNLVGYIDGGNVAEFFLILDHSTTIVDLSTPPVRIFHIPTSVTDDGTVLSVGRNPWRGGDMFRTSWTEALARKGDRLSSTNNISVPSDEREVFIDANTAFLNGQFWKPWAGDRGTFSPAVIEGVNVAAMSPNGHYLGVRATKSPVGAASFDLVVGKMGAPSRTIETVLLNGMIEMKGDGLMDSNNIWLPQSVVEPLNPSSPPFLQAHFCRVGDDGSALVGLSDKAKPYYKGKNSFFYPFPGGPDPSTGVFVGYGAKLLAIRSDGSSSEVDESGLNNSFYGRGIGPGGLVFGSAFTRKNTPIGVVIPFGEKPIILDTLLPTNVRCQCVRRITSKGLLVGDFTVDEKSAIVIVNIRPLSAGH